MKKTIIKDTDLEVSIVAFGTNRLGINRTQSLDYSLLDRFVDEGGNFIDTARIYSDWVPGEIGRSERILGEWLKARNYPKDLVIATKGGFPDLKDNGRPRLQKSDIEYDVELSLKTLGVETIDLYYLHRDDESTPVEEILDSMEDFKKRGYFRYYACSNWNTQRIIKAQAYAKSKGYDGFKANQMLWNLGSANMEEKRDMMDGEMYDYHIQTNLSAVPYTSQANGYFTKIINDRDKGTSLQVHSDKNEKLAKELYEKFSEAKSPMQYVLGFFANRPFQIIPIFTSQSMEQLEDTLYAAEHPIDPEIKGV